MGPLEKNFLARRNILLKRNPIGAPAGGGLSEVHWELLFPIMEYYSRTPFRISEFCQNSQKWVRIEAANRGHPHSSKSYLESRGLTTRSKATEGMTGHSGLLQVSYPNHSCAADGGQALWVLPTRPGCVDQEDFFKFLGITTQKTQSYKVSWNQVCAELETGSTGL